ncbi:MAG TPA: hypothetical protein VHQ45_19125 [Gemmatimonadaceae bacterium]|nr:hypothetical protein [Gemmatimonadaceae bacterium]
MPSTRMRRWSALLMGVLLTLVVGEPLRLHACAAHDPALAVLAGMGGAQGGHHGAMATHAGTRQATAHQSAARHATGAAVAEAAAPSADDATPPRCACLGTCCTAAPLGAVAMPRVALVAVVEQETRPLVLVATAPRARAHHVLPFANGPPALS